ncbi:hypothetical protein ACT4S5_09295 [Kocuria oceani]|uniref:hypothetical protein n=1 Tax=Kocuria oceani TaxID=988827 RepID=UPI0040370392
MSMVRTCRALSAGTLGVAVVPGAAGCGASAGVEEGPGPLRISAIPDVDPSDPAEREEAMAA